MWHQQEIEWRGGDADAAAREPRVREPRDRSTTTTDSGVTAGNVYISGDPAIADAYEYNVQINFSGTWSTDLRQAFISCAEAISDFIVGDVPNVSTRRSSIDDISINASLVSIDGAGGILGQAGPDAIRSGSYLPSRGTMQFDSADASYYQSAGLFDDIVLHEMLHTVGFGTIWNYLGLTSGGSFVGARATAAYPGDGYVPLELDGGPGTAYAHWDEGSALGSSELMTGYIDGDNYLSYTTIASLGDLGYSTVSGSSYVSPWFI